MTDVGDEQQKRQRLEFERVMGFHPRHGAPKQQLESMTAHRGMCHYCHGAVVMGRDEETAALAPYQCSCIQCGQRYFMIIDNLKTWEVEQWRQKAGLE